MCCIIFLCPFIKRYININYFVSCQQEVHLSRKSHDSSLCSRIAAACSAHGVVRKPHAGAYETMFYVRHYAGDVLYSVSGAVTKNKVCV